MKRFVLLAVTLMFVVMASACSSDTKVGEDINLDQLKGKGGTRLGETTTTAASATTAPNVTAPPATKATPTTAAQAVALEIKIQAAAPQFNPSVGTTRQGTLVRFTNTDTQARSVEADGGAFVSPSIPPGGHWDLKAPAPGTYNYHDGTRPYAVAQLQVV